MPEHEQVPSRRDPGCRGAQHGADLGLRKVQVGDHDEIEPPVGSVAAGIRDDPLHLGPQLVRTLPCQPDAFGGEVDPDHVPAALGEKDRVPSVAGGEVERAPGSECPDQFAHGLVRGDRPESAGRVR